MKEYNRKRKKLKLADPEKISRLLIDAIKIHFPIQHEETVRTIIEFIDERLKIPINVDLLETELLKATRKVKLQFIIQNYFTSLRHFFHPETKTKTVIIQTVKRKRDELPIVKPLKEAAKEVRERELQEIKERDEEEKRMRKKLKKVKGWTSGIYITTWGDDPYTPPPMEE